MSTALAYHCRVRFRTAQVRGLFRYWTAQHIDTMLYEAICPVLNSVADVDNLGPPYAPLIKDGTWPVLQRVVR